MVVDGGLVVAGRRLITGGLIASGLIASGLIAGGLVAGGLIAGGLVAGGLLLGIGAGWAARPSNLLAENDCQKRVTRALLSSMLMA